MIVIEYWFGRLGNNIRSLSNIIDIALFYKHNIKFNVTHDFFNLEIIENYFSKYNNKEEIKDPYNFFFSYKLNFLPEVFNFNNKKKIKLLKKAFKIKNIKKLDKNNIVVYIRSGDTFNNNNVLSTYSPPPLCYFTSILNKKEYNKIIIVAEDNKNPLVNKLLQLYKNSIWNKNSFTDDIKLILGATNIVKSVGTLINMLILLSDNVRNVKSPNYKKLKKYYLVNKPWFNNEEQRNNIINYKCEKKLYRTTKRNRNKNKKKKKKKK